MFCGVFFQPFFVSNMCRIYILGWIPEFSLQILHKLENESFQISKFCELAGARLGALGRAFCPPERTFTA